MKYYINIFLIFSILGFILESTLKYFFFPGTNNGFLYGPWVPVYGFGTCLIIIIMRFIFKRIKVKNYIKTILIFFISMASLTILEFISGNLIKMITGKIFWNYSKMKFNIGPFISLEISLIWGIMAIIISYILKPIIDKIIEKIPSIITYLVLFIMIIDIIVTIF